MDGPFAWVVHLICKYKENVCISKLIRENIVYIIKNLSYCVKNADNRENRCIFAECENYAII